MIVDGHAHVFRPPTISPRGIDELAPADRDAPVEDLLQVMGSHGVRSAVLVPLDEHDSYVAATVDANPDIFAAVAVADRRVQGRAGEDPLVALGSTREPFGFHALRTQWLGEPGQPITSSPFYPVLNALAEGRVPLWSYLPPDQVPLLEPLVRALPELTIVLNHLGFSPRNMRVDRHRRPAFDDPFPEGTLSLVSRLGRHPNVHVMFSGQYALSRQPPPYRDLDDAVHRIADGFGADRMMWASDYPWTKDVPGYGALLELCRQTFPDASTEEMRAIQGGTAVRLFPHLIEHE